MILCDMGDHTLTMTMAITTTTTTAITTAMTMATTTTKKLHQDFSNIILCDFIAVGFLKEIGNRLANYCI